MSEFGEPGQSGNAQFRVKMVLKDSVDDVEDVDLETGMVVLNMVDDDERGFIDGLVETTETYFRIGSSEDEPYDFPVMDLEDLNLQALRPGTTLHNWIPMTGKPAGKIETSDEFLEYIVIDNVQSILEELTSTGGFIAAALVDATSGMLMGSVTGAADFDIEIAAATNTDVVKAKMKAMEALQLDDRIEDILISLGSQYHLIRPLKDEPYIFVYLAVDRQHANLALCRRAMALTEEKLKV